MKQLERHIEILLLSNDCVMVPGLGGFMTHHVCSTYNENDHQMFPPLRTLGFNPKLKANDNLLAQSYVEAFDISYPEAMQRIEDEVGELLERLNNDGSYMLNDIGTLTINDEGNIEFAPVKAGLLTPELYALDSVSVKMLSELPTIKATNAKDNVTEEAKAQVIDINAKPNNIEEQEAEDDNGDSIKIKVSLLRNIAAVAIALIGFFLFTSPLANGNYKMNMSNINTELLYQIMPKTIVREGVNDAKPVIAEKDAASSKEKEIAQTTDIPTETKQAPVNETNINKDIVAAPVAKTYSLVLASHFSKVNGDAFLEAIHKDGFTDARIVEVNNIRKILYGQYDSESKAYEELNKLHSNKFFKQAWVIEVKNN
ncbi:MAG: SPOR domain-containing protein [Prevotellaceae bacterium]|nr:SPOR domain-containing protein [Prevotellaceae bacterium]